MVLGHLQLLLGQLIQGLDPASPKPANDRRKCFQIPANGSCGVALIAKPPHEIIQDRSEEWESAPPGKGSGTQLNEERYNFHRQEAMILPGPLSIMLS